MKEWESAIMAIFGGIIAVAIVSVIVSKNAQAPQVISAGAKALSSVVAAAVAPITNSSNVPNIGSNTFSTPNVLGLGQTN